MRIACSFCGNIAEKASGSVNRSRRAGLPLFCGRVCFGLSRRTYKSAEQKRAEKAEYDAKRRAALADTIKVQKADYHRKTYDPAKQAAYNKRRMPRHVAYCQRPEYRAYKAGYDRQYRAREYGPFADCFLLIQDLQSEVLTRMSRYEIDLANGKLGKTQKRKRDDARTFRC